MEAIEAIAGASNVLEYGTQKYDRANWHKGLPWTEVIDSMLRHLAHFLDGEDFDKESGLPHVDHITCNALFLAEFYRTRREFDDRHSATTTNETEGDSTDSPDLLPDISGCIPQFYSHQERYLTTNRRRAKYSRSQLTD